MAVNRLYLRNTNNAIGKVLSLTQGTSGGQLISTTSQTGPAQILVGHWAYQPGAVTVSGTITFNFWAYELSMAANAGLRCEISRLNSVGTVLSTVVASSRGVELSTSQSVNNWTAAATSTSFVAGDWLRVSLYDVDAGGTMAAGTELRHIYDDTVGNLADSWVEVDLAAAATKAFPFPIPRARRALMHTRRA